MYHFKRDYLERMGWLHAEIERQICDLPQAALDWSPGPDMPSMCALVTHLTGAERYWIGDVVAGVSSDRDREAEFAAKGCHQNALTAKMELSREYAGEIIRKMKYEDLSSQRISPRDGKRISAGYALNYTLEHTAIHLGHIQIIRQLWEQRITE
jgi:leucyl aminopeptidase